MKIVTQQILVLVFLVIITRVSAQKFSTIAKLPESIKETSGIETHQDGLLWTFNDSGGEPELYLVDLKGTLIKTLYVKNSWNRDWEDISRDDKGNMYIGNIGNNSNKNTDLCIFKIPDPDLIAEDTVEAKVIHFNFEDQTMFPPEEYDMYFDCETLMWYKGNLYLVTKNRTKPFDGIANLYRIPDQPGTYQAKKIGVFNAGNQDRYGFWITGGDISDDGKMMALLASDKVWIFKNFKNDNFFTGQYRMIRMPISTQKEGICFKDNYSLYITDEGWKGGLGRNIYRLIFDKSD